MAGLFMFLVFSLPAAARSFTAPLTRRSSRYKSLNSDGSQLYAGSDKSPLCSGCFAIRRGPCRCPAASATTRYSECNL